MRLGALCAVLLSFSLGVPSAAAAEPLSLDCFNEQETRLRLSVMRAVGPFVQERKKAGTAPLVTFEELHARLSPEQINFLERMRRIDPSQTGGSNRLLPTPETDASFVRLEGQVVLREGKPVAIEAQYLPAGIYEKYLEMMAAMERELGKRLLVESGYRSPAYQLYLFLYYMPKHGYSIRETSRFVALPGYSEHGSPAFQAIDFITPEGINGEDRPEEFEELQEYGWLHARAPEFGFRLSYPRIPKGPGQPGTFGDGASAAFEPWHWHWQAPPARLANEEDFKPP